MKILTNLLLIILFTTSLVNAQGILKVETNKYNYVYGETIEVSVTLLNNSDTSFTILGNITCFARINFDDVYLEPACISAIREYYFPPNSSRTWIWELDPKIYGIPDKNGEHIIRGFCAGLIDSTKIVEPKYYGGRVRAKINIEVPEEEVQRLRDSLEATVLWHSDLSNVGFIAESWQIKNHSIDSLANAYWNNERISFEIDRRIEFDREIVTSVTTKKSLINDYSLSQNYPNPFNPTTTINYSISEACYVSLVIYDVTGKEISTMVKEVKPIGKYKIDFNANNLSSGIYFYQLRTKNFIETKKMIFMK